MSTVRLPAIWFRIASHGQVVVVDAVYGIATDTYPRALGRERIPFGWREATRRYSQLDLQDAWEACNAPT